MEKIISYNLNGIRAVLRKGFENWLVEEKPDILCVQETKAQEEQIDKIIFSQLNYHQYWFSAEKKGYSGVGILSKIKPDKVVIGMNNEKYDREGRLIRADFGDITIINAYHPSGSSGELRQKFKMEWLEDFENFVLELRKERPKLILMGDFNIANENIDIHHPERHHKTSGFLPEERAWFSNFLKHGFIDSFREIYPKDERYSWWSYRGRAREKNLGWRIDYNLLSENLKENLKKADILKEIKFSDHSPVLIEINV